MKSKIPSTSCLYPFSSLPKTLLDCQSHLHLTLILGYPELNWSNFMKRHEPTFIHTYLHTNTSKVKKTHRLKCHFDCIGNGKKVAEPKQLLLTAYIKYGKKKLLDLDTSNVRTQGSVSKLHYYSHSILWYLFMSLATVESFFFSSPVLLVEIIWLLDCFVLG